MKNGNIARIDEEKESNFVSAVIYVKENEKEIYVYLEKIERILKENFEKYEIICVNDSSSDKSLEEIKRFVHAKNESSITVINMSYYQGKEACMNAGVDLSIGDYVFEFDNILLHFDANIIMKIYHQIFCGYDIVNAVPVRKNHVTSKLFYMIFNRYANVQYELETDAFRVLSRRAVNRVHSMSKTIPYRKALYANCGLKQCSVKVELEIERKESRQTEGMKKELALESLILFTNAAYKFATIITIVMMALTICLGAYTIAVFAMGISITGWTTIMLVLSVSFFCVFAILTIMLKYLAIIVSLIFKKKDYVLESIDKLSS